MSWAFLKHDIYSQLFNLVVTAGRQGISQRGLLESTSLKSNQISKIAIRLEKSGLIARERSLEDGRWTFLLKAANAMNLGPYESNPCMRCHLEDRCEPGGIVTPERCALEIHEQGLSDWVVREYRREKPMMLTPTS